jgi:mannosyltransferase OCH1-like enzyme
MATVPVPGTTPRTIHQTWKTTEVPEKLKPYQQEWQRLHPDYNYILHTDTDIRAQVETYFPQYLAQYDGFSSHIERVDFARYVILYQHGGVYADLDTKPLKPMDDWIQKNKVVLGREPLEHSRKMYCREIVLCNALMVSPPGDPYWLALMQFIMRNYERNYSPVATTGPIAMTKMYEQQPEDYRDVIITNPCVFFPITNAASSSKTQCLAPDNCIDHVSKHCNLEDAYVIHVWANTWTPTWLTSPMWGNPIFIVGVVSLLVAIYLLLAEPRIPYRIPLALVLVIIGLYPLYRDKLDCMFRTVNRPQGKS